ncbi:MAG: hypothetical protein ACI9R3_005327, partial [Verrucomicrobiales bacterium]
ELLITNPAVMDSHTFPRDQLSMFTGGMLAAPYCCVLILLRISLERLSLIKISDGDKTLDTKT